MKVVLLLGICFLGYIRDVCGLTCYSCNNDTHFEGGTSANDDCYDNLNGAGTTVTITANNTASNQYCFTKVTLKDGFVTAIRRDTTNGDSDTDLKTTGIPQTSPQCTITFDSGNIVTTTCVHICTTNNCNTQTTSNYKACSTNCSETEARGYCDYFSGSCACKAGYRGSNCNSAVSTTYRSCVQCNSETNSNCEGFNQSTQCLFNADASLVYCSSSKTTLYNSSSVVLTSVTKGCVMKSSGTPTVQCAFTDMEDNQFIGYGEYTCTATCDSDGCNGKIPAGNSALECVQCTGTTDSAGCGTQIARFPCPTGSQQCYSKVVYFTANKTNHKETDDPDYKFSSIERSCRSSSNSVSQCTTTQLGVVDMVTCEESCSTAGCNVGWPNRPRCFQCNSRSSAFDSCIYNPGEARACPKPFQSFCAIRETYKEGTVRNAPPYDGYEKSMWRGCSYHDLGNTCADSVVDGVTFKQCNKTCTTHGCNQGNGAVKAVQSYLVFFLATFLGILVQHFFA